MKKGVNGMMGEGTRTRGGVARTRDGEDQDKRWGKICGQPG